MKRLLKYKLFENTFTPDELGIELLKIINNTEFDDIGIKDYIKHGANLNVSDSYGNTPLIRAAIMDRLDIIKLLIDAGADIGKRNRQGECFIQYIMYTKENSIWLKSKEVQRMLFKMEPSLIYDFKGRLILLDPEIEREFAYLFTGSDLNLM